MNMHYEIYKEYNNCVSKVDRGAIIWKIYWKEIQRITEFNKQHKDNLSFYYFDWNANDHL